MIIDCAHYKDGQRQHEGKLSLGQAAKCVTGEPGEFVWLGLFEPSAEELQQVAAQFHLHELAVEDAALAHQRPKLEDYDDSFFIVLKTARYDEAAEQVHFGEIHIFVAADYVIHVRHGEGSELTGARQRLEERPELLKQGTPSVVWAILDKVVDDYYPVAQGIEDDIEEAEAQVFDEGDQPTERIYFLKREVIEFHRAVGPLLIPLEKLESGRVSRAINDELRRFFRDVADHARRIDDQVNSQRELLTSALEANLALVSVRQNDVIKEISSWAAIITVPTFIASVYGMNFEHIPELKWRFGYPLALVTMAIAVFFLYRFFKRVGWLS
ncbi:MAG TPA: magnesium/cobalt transporter CorA [Solirubrobacterales bacterium]|jgi:magnesium transporter